MPARTQRNQKELCLSRGRGLVLRADHALDANERPQRGATGFRKLLPNVLQPYHGLKTPEGYFSRCLTPGHTKLPADREAI